MTSITPPDWLFNTRIGAWVTRAVMKVGSLVDRLLGRLGKQERRQEGMMLKIGVVGDLSLQDPQRLWRCLSAARASSDVVVQLGDCHPGYAQMLQAKTAMDMQNRLRAGASYQKGFFAIPGNHDIDWGAKLGWPRLWKADYKYGDGSPAFHLVGLDNSADKLSPDAWPLLDGVPADGAPIVLFCHKPLSTIVLPDGSESGHVMGEGNLPNADAERLKEWCFYRHTSHAMKTRSNRNLGMDSGLVEKGNPVLLVHGHYHAHAQFLTDYCPCLVEGRGGAAGTGPGELGYTTIIVTPEGLTMHRVDL